MLEMETHKEIKMHHLTRAWHHAPIFHKVFLANAAIILIGAIGGTFITQQLWLWSGSLLALFFATVGTALSLVVNYVILRNALNPLYLLERTLDQIDRGDTTVRAPVEAIGDPELLHLARALNTMLGRLAIHTRMLEKHRARLRELSGRVFIAQEEERKRIARELHDDTSGALARVLLNIEMCEELISAEPPELRDKIQHTRLIAEQALETVHKLIFDLRPTLLDDLGLVAAMRWYAKENFDAAGIQLQFHAADDLGRAAPASETALYRIAQEAVTNIIRHARAHHARIELARDQARWVLTVQDDGHGFDARDAAPERDEGAHWGLFGMYERVQLLGGALNITSQVGGGTSLRVEIPVE
jgi:two-component system sensor histidine kinase UhpB